MTTDDLKEELRFLKTKLKSLPVDSQDFDMTLAEFQRVSEIIHHERRTGETLKKQKMSVGNYKPTWKPVVKASEKRKKESSRMAIIMFIVLVVWWIVCLLSHVAWFWGVLLVLIVINIVTLTTAFFEQTYPHRD